MICLKQNGKEIAAKDPFFKSNVPVNLTLDGGATTIVRKVEKKSRIQK
jgi:hypothetical protein